MPLPMREKFLQRRNLICLSVCLNVFKIFTESDGHTLLGTVEKFNTDWL